MENILEYLESNRLSELKNILNEENPVDIAEHFEDLSKEKTRQNSLASVYLQNDKKTKR